MEETVARVVPSRSLVAASSLLLGIVAGQSLARPQLPLSIALCGIGIAAPRRWRCWLLAVAVGLTLSWRSVSPDRGPEVDFDRPLIVVAHQTGVWREIGDQWRTLVKVEHMRQGALVVSWPMTIRLTMPGGVEPAGTRWRLHGYLRRPAMLANGVRGRPPQWRLQVKSARLVDQLADHRWSALPAAVIRLWRRQLGEAVTEAAADRAGGALARALVLGDSTALPESWVRGLRRTGLAHVTALSGLHLGILAAWCAWFGRRAPPAVRWTLVAIVTSLYLCVGGARPSLVRSSLMVAAAGTAAISRRSTRSLHALAWAAALLAALHPQATREIGFQLTFAASAGVILGNRHLPGRWPRLRRTLARPLATTLGAQLATAPLALTAFHWLPAWAWLWNLALVPVVALAVPACLLWVAVALVSPALASHGTAAVDVLASLIGAPSSLPPGLFGGWPWAAGAVATTGITAAVSASLRYPRSVLVAIAILLQGVGPGPWKTGVTSLHFLDVGQGEAVLVRDGASTLLVDGGGWRGPGVAERALLPSLGRLGVRRLETVILSHGDRDHCRGVLELADYVAIDEVWLSPGTALSDCGLSLSLLFGIRLRPLWAGKTADWRGWRFVVLSPPAGVRGSGNEESLVLRGESRGRSVLLTGDIGHSTEHRLLGCEQREALEVTLLKVAHHGSGSSSSTSFLGVTSPRLAVISAGHRNPFGHPASSVLERLERQGVPVLRTDRVGLIEVSWSSSSFWRLAMPGAPK
jgi:competence protein ComEC